MLIRANVLILFASLCICGMASGQRSIDAPVLPDTVRWMSSLYLDIGVPLQQFDVNMEWESGLGFGGELFFRIQKNGLIWGGAGVHSFALDRYSVAYSQQIDNEIYNYVDKTTSRIFTAHAILRFQPDWRFVIRPYVQGAVGPHWFFTNTKIRDTDFDEIVDRINESRDVVLGFALHGGVQIVPYRLPDMRADFRVGYFRNASVEYLRYNENLAFPGGFPVDAFERKVSPVDMLGIQAGVTVMLRPNAYE